jgi:hypothetical protein
MKIFGTGLSKGPKTAVIYERVISFQKIFSKITVLKDTENVLCIIGGKNTFMKIL